MIYLLKQAKLILAIYIIPVFVAGLLVPGYNIIKQHASEITLTQYKNAILIFNSGMIASGISCVLLGVGIIFNFKKFYLSSFMLIVFGISMISNGIFPMGNIMHGFYGIGLIIMLLPFAACYELKNENAKKIFFKISIISGLLTFVYFWAMIVRLDPENYRGLTQRIVSVLIFGWIAYFAREIEKDVV
ncbi:DUF998 domain-containing protein [Flavobacterium zhairuonense]|uniref:DUF998 domain-containing protein n=1 Tax=Flavobacterium zhairuonense TaxID=2493631 RepID=UPI0010487D9F|nr:DUF998 domain-containing protein [Flavobacterium zhairuonense]KAF2515911.1 DUF998 domain-containing protein [Flavobacterium zhairuonense]